jgi:DNA-binding response OmpR family regulator
MLPVVILTSSRKEKDLLKIYELGANAYLVKPVDFVKFIDAIRQLGVFLGDNQRETSGNRGIQ